MSWKVIELIEDGVPVSYGDTVTLPFSVIRRIRADIIALEGRVDERATLRKLFWWGMTAVSCILEDMFDFDTNGGKKKYIEYILVGLQLLINCDDLQLIGKYTVVGCF
jgi:hypothetical protein